ncbi:MerR family transcriptional regulator [Streptomyces luteogriseus]|uniref:MerR family transcriptional regulator n=1 Tax=Streptomyces luteogriseus TaxID=68233 RepID=UPI002E310FD1|nr:MerR family transcriptional regulator [Streptomyces luteogriseus]WTJ28098.1 cobalamin B12-binding domain-containing protein [Streptomyces luteogriseus]
MGVHERDSEDRGRGGAPVGVGLTTGEVARRLGVAPTTVRTWDRRYGLGPDAHTGGRHRRWTATDVARLERMCALTATGIPPAEAARTVLGEATREPDPAGWASPPPPEAAPEAPPAAPPDTAPEAPWEAAAEEAGEAAPGRRGADTPPRPSAPARSRAGSGLRLGDVRQECKGIARAALRLDAAALDGLLETAIVEHGLIEAWTEVIMPTLQAVGRKWESSGEKYVEVEHFLSWHVSGALRRGAPPSAADRPGATVVLACVPGENHTLPLEVLAAALAERGLPVRMFGAALPVESLVTAVRRTGPAAVGLWAQSRTTASRPLAQHVAAMEWGVRGARRKPVVLTIGPGWTGRTVTGLPRPAGLAEAVALLESVVSR